MAEKLTKDQLKAVLPNIQEVMSRHGYRQHPEYPEFYGPNNTMQFRRETTPLRFFGLIAYAAAQAVYGFEKDGVVDAVGSYLPVGTRAIGDDGFLKDLEQFVEKAEREMDREEKNI